MRPGAREKETAACSSNEGSSSAVSPSPGGLPLVLAVGRLSGRSSPGVCRWGPSVQRLPGLDATPAARRTDAAGSIAAPAPGGGGAGLRAHCNEARHVTVRTHPLQVCLASLDGAPIRSAYGRHPPRPLTVGPGADVRDVTGEVGQPEAGKEWTAKRYTAVRRWVGACGMARGLSGATAPGRRRRRARWRCAPWRAPRRGPCTRRSARRCLRHTVAGPCGAAIAPLLRRTGSRRLRAHAPRAWIRSAPMKVSSRSTVSRRGERPLASVAPRPESATASCPNRRALMPRRWQYAAMMRRKVTLSIVMAGDDSCRANATEAP